MARRDVVVATNEVTGVLERLISRRRVHVAAACKTLAAAALFVKLATRFPCADSLANWLLTSASCPSRRMSRSAPRSSAVLPTGVASVVTHAG